MKKETVYYVTFFAPGSFVAETWTRSVASPDPAAVAFPDNAYAFTIHERIDALEPDGTRYKGDPRQIGPTYYHPDSKVETLAEVERNPNASRILVSNMQCNEWKQVVWSRWGGWPQPFDPAKHAVLPAPMKP